ncbi:phage tail protein [Novosphingobium sp. YAF33]|uniref:phage tail protein n=1 Tax=Novosphingobium sp. YAF33 TaxID=3233082 RepID=UPI003F9CFB7F
MAKMLKTAGIVVAAVALVAMTAGAAAPAVVGSATAAASAGGVAGVSAATLTAIGAYGGLAASVLTAAASATAPGVTSQGTATKFQTNPQSGLPYAMGRTRMSGLRFFAATNTRPGYTKFNDLLWFGALLSIGGPIGGIEEFKADGEVVTFDASGNAVGNFRDYMAQKVHLGGPMSTALNLSLGGGTAPGWTAQHKLSGITHAMWCLRYNKQGEMYGAGAPEPAWIGKWVKVYDPRLDSTYPGGSGPCRALDESTYVWSDNPGLHALTWALGRWQNGERTCGIGAPVETIRMAEFVECANVCEANGWTVGGVEWTTDSKWDSLKRILQAGGARPTQTAAMIGCLVNMPRTAIATIESWHLHDGLSLAATKSRRERISSVIPRYVDEDSDWELISGTAITVAEYATADKGKRTKEIDFPLVQVFSGQEAKQPGQLAAYEIVNSREAGPWTFTTGPEWIGLKTGDVVYLNVPEEGLVNQPVMITRRAIDPSTGKVSFAVETETYSKHAYALGQSTTPPAPFTLSAPDLKPPAPVASGWTVAGTTSGEGFPALLIAGESEMPSADAVVIDYRLHQGNETATDGWTNSAILSAVDTVRHVISPLQSETRYDVRISYRVEAIDGAATIFEQVLTGVGKITTIENQIDDIAQAGKVTAHLSVPAVSLYAYANGGILDYSAASGKFLVLRGTQDISASFSFEILSNPANLDVALDGNAYAVTGGLDADSASLTMRASGTGAYAGTSFDLVFTVSRIMGGYEIVSALPTANLFEGRIVYNSADGKLYTYTSGAWKTGVNAADIAGDIVADQFAPTIEPVTLVTSVPTEKSTNVVFNTANGKTYRWNGQVYVATVEASDIAGGITASQFASGIEPITNVTSLPSTKVTTVVAYNGKLYRWNGSSYTASVATTDLSGSIVAAQFASGIEPVTLVSGALPTSRVTNVITYGGKLYRWNGAAYVASVPTTDLTGTITDAQIAAMSAAKLAGQITSTQITDDAVTTPKIAAGAVTAAEIAAGAVTASKIAVGDFSNLILNGDLVSGALDGWSRVTASAVGAAGSSIICDGPANGWPTTYGINMYRASGATGEISIVNGNVSFDNANYMNGGVDLAAGEQIYFECYTWGTNTTAGLLVEMLMRLPGNATTYGSQPAAALSNCTGGFYLVAKPGQNVIKISGYFTNNTGVAGKAYLRFVHTGFSGVAAGAQNTNVYVWSAKATRRNAGKLIVDGAITANQIAGQTITAAQIATDTITAAQIAAGAIAASELAAGSVTASKMAIQGENLWPDPFVQDLSWWKGPSQGSPVDSGYVNPANNSNGQSAGWQLVDSGLAVFADRVGGSKGMWQLWSGNNNDQFTSTAIAQVVPPSLWAKSNTTYELGIGCYNQSNRSLTVQVQYFDTSGAYIGGTQLIVFAPGDVSSKIKRAKFTTPANCVTVRIYWDSQAGVAFSGVCNVGNITLREAASGTMIVDGTITAGHIASQTITAAQIATDTITAAQIAAGAINAAELAAGSVTTAKLAVVPNNLIPDPYFADTAWWSATRLDAGGWYFEGNNGSSGGAFEMGVPKCVVLGPQANLRKHCWSASVPFSGQGQVLRLRAMGTNGSNDRMYLTVRFRGAAGDLGDLGVNWEPLAGNNILRSAQMAVPTGTTHYQVIVFNEGNTVSNGYMWIGAPKLDIAASADLLVDGSITASKIAADTITAGQIAAGAISASEIATGAVTAAKMTVAEFENLLLNGDLASGNLDGWSRSYNGVGGMIVQCEDGGVGTGWPSRYAVHILRNGNTSVSELSITNGVGNWDNNDKRYGIPVNPGDEFAFETTCWCANGATVQFDMIMLDTSGQLQWMACESVQNTYLNSTTNLGATPGEGYVVLKGTFRNVSGRQGRANVRFIGPLASTPNAHCYFWNSKMRRRNAAELIVDGNITATKIASSAVTTDKISAGAVTAAKIAVTELSAITANLGLMRTATTGRRTEIDSNGMRAYDANGTLRVRAGVWAV